jgi:hypothetical protein
MERYRLSQASVYRSLAPDQPEAEAEAADEPERSAPMAEPLLFIDNDGPAITRTNYWSTALARRGTFYLSSHAGAFRLLVPPQHQGTLRAMRSAKVCVVSRGPYPDLQWPDALEILFDDGSTDPFSVYLSPEAIDRMPHDQDRAYTWTLSVWTHRVGQACTKALEFPCHYRRVLRLPALRPWQP